MRKGRLMRRQQQPGPATAERLTVVAGKLRHFSVTLEAGIPVNQAIGRAMMAQGCRSGVLELQGCVFQPLRFVMPAPSPDAEHAAFYSEVHEAAGPARCEQLRVTYGEKDGEPFTHLHGSWTGADGRRQAGHILPLEAMLAEPAPAFAWVIEEAGFTIRSDPETNFSLFTPEPWQAASSMPTGVLVKIQPNEDACTALEEVCRRVGWISAQVRGGVGSLVGVRFANGTSMERMPTEVLVRKGHVQADPATGAPVARLDLLAVDDAGSIGSGLILRGDNPVLMTFELLLTPR
jgi:predicted DNA-binding protein with PD1-like motif